MFGSLTAYAQPTRSWHAVAGQLYTPEHSMFHIKRLFRAPPNTFALRQRHDTAGLLAALGHELAWVRRDAAQSLGQLQEAQFRGPLTLALQDSDAEVREAAQVALAQLNR